MNEDEVRADGDVDDLAVLDGDHAELVLASERPADRHPAVVYLARLAPGSRRTMQQALNAIAAQLTGGRCDLMNLDWTRVGYQHTAAVRTVLAETHAPATVNKMLSALRGVLKECWRLGYTDAETYQRASDIPPVRGSSLQRGRALSMGELTTLFAACGADKRPAGARDAAILGLLYGAGLRRSELVALNLSDYHPDTAEIRVRRGKGRKARVCYAPRGAVQALDRWIEVRGYEHGPLFYPINRGNRIIHRRLSDQTVLDMLESRAKKHGVAAFSPHDLRRTFIGDLLDRGADLSTVQQLAGHANVQTTARYDRRGEVTRRKAVDLLHVPYVHDGDA